MVVDYDDISRAFIAVAEARGDDIGDLRAENARLRDEIEKLRDGAVLQLQYSTRRCDELARVIRELRLELEQATRAMLTAARYLEHLRRLSGKDEVWRFVNSWELGEAHNALLNALEASDE